MANDEDLTVCEVLFGTAIDERKKRIHKSVTHITARTHKSVINVTGTSKSYARQITGTSYN